MTILWFQDWKYSLSIIHSFNLYQNPQETDNATQSSFDDLKEVVNTLNLSQAQTATFVRVIEKVRFCFKFLVNFRSSSKIEFAKLLCCRSSMKSSKDVVMKKCQNQNSLKHQENQNWLLPNSMKSIMNLKKLLNFSRKKKTFSVLV